VVALLHDQPIAHRLSQAGKTLWDLRRMWLLARETIPLGFATMLARLANSAPRFVINAVLGLEALGLFTAVSYIWQAGMMAMQQATNSLSAHLSRMHHEGRHKPFWKLIGRYATLFAVGSLACMVASLLIGDVLLGIAFGPKYRDGDQLLALVFLVMALQSAAVVCEMGMLAQRQFKTFARMRAVLVVAAFALSAAGARLDGIIGVGWGLVAVSAMQLLGAVWMLRRGQSLAPVTAGRQ
jgi:O-antigen/teichoic acid export membrane protein